MALLDNPNYDDIAQVLGINPKSAKEKAFTEGLLGSIFQAAALSGPQPRPISTAQALGQVGLSGYQTYKSALDQQLQDALTGLKARSMVAEMVTPKYMTIKTPAGGEALIQIPKAGGAPSQVAIPGLDMATKPIDFDASTQAFMSLKFGKTYNELNPDEKTEVLQFMNAPNDEKLATLRIESEKQQYETGVKVPIPRGRSEFLVPQPPVQPSPVQPSPTHKIPVKVSKTLQLPVDMAVKPLGENEVPLIQSSGISPKQKSQLELERPQTYTATQYGINQIRQTRNTIRELLNDPNFNLAFGFGGETVSNVYTPAADVRAKLESLRDQQFARNITAMRDASKTGAAVGNVTQQEGARFENMQGNLKQFQSAKQARSTLERMEKELEDSETRLSNSYSRYYGGTSFDVMNLYTPPEKQKSLNDIFFPGRKK